MSAISNIARNFASMIQFHLSYSHWRLALIRYGWDWKEVGRWQVAATIPVAYLTIAFCPGFLNTSLSHVSSMLDGWPTILQRAHFFPFFSLLCASFCTCSFFFAKLPSFSIFILLSDSAVLFHPPFFSRMPGPSIFFANYFPPTLLISSFVYRLVHRGQEDWAAQTSNSGENGEKKFLYLEI